MFTVQTVNVSDKLIILTLAQYFSNLFNDLSNAVVL